VPRLDVDPARSRRADEAGVGQPMATAQGSRYCRLGFQGGWNVEPSPVKGAAMDEPKHSGLGIASFITSMVAGVLIFLLIVIAGVMEASTPGGIDEESPAAVAIGLFLFAFIGVALVALGLGVGGLMQANRKKIFAILGTVFSSVSIVGTLFIMLLGLAAGQ
jgi:hypothetical protein